MKEEDQPLPPELPTEEDLHLVDPGPKRKSKFWSYYKAYDLDHHPEKTHTARCTLCGKDISVKQGTGGLVRHLQHKHADESDDLVAITSSYPTPGSAARYSDIGSNAGENGEDDLLVIGQPLRKKSRVSSTVPVEVTEAKIKREEHNLRMWKDAKAQLKELKEELMNAQTQEDIDELEADIEGFKKRKAIFAKHLGLPEVAQHSQAI